MATASQKLAEQLRAKGSPAHYIPQFTDTARFYPDFEESLKSDVLFVGANTFYRTAVPFLKQRGIAVDVYGPKWPIGTAKANYADNRILRKYYSSAKIVLNDTREGMKRFGFISNRIFDATACGTLVISDYMPEIEAAYGDAVPMYKNKEELAGLLRYYLTHEEERQALAAKARRITLEKFTNAAAARAVLKAARTSCPLSYSGRTRRRTSHAFSPVLNPPQPAAPAGSFSSILHLFRFRRSEYPNTNRQTGLFPNKHPALLPPEHAA